jgi:hypothetical protein
MPMELARDSVIGSTAGARTGTSSATSRDATRPRTAATAVQLGLVLVGFEKMLCSSSQALAGSLESRRDRLQGELEVRSARAFLGRSKFGSASRAEDARGHCAPRVAVTTCATIARQSLPDSSGFQRAQAERQALSERGHSPPS